MRVTKEIREQFYQGIMEVKALKRQKRKYIILIIAAAILPFSIAVLYTSIDKNVHYGKAQATIISVDTEERKGGTYDDKYYYIESEIECSYIVDNFEYTKKFEIKGDYSGREGENITVLYNKEKPFECVMGTGAVTAIIYSAVFTVGSICYIFIDIRSWRNIRKEENKNLSQVTLSDSDMQQYSEQMKKQKRTNTILTIASAVGAALVVFNIVINASVPGAILLVVDDPLIVYTAARNIDYRLCSRI